MSGETRPPAARYSRSIASLMLAPATLCLASCGSKADGRLPVFPVAGSVLSKGLPAIGAIVTFHPVDAAAPAALRPNGKVEGDGSFRLTTYEAGDGAPAGEYVVTIFWPEPPKSPIDAPDAGPDRLEGRFADPQRSGIRASVSDAATELEPFRLD